ncbi:MAG: helix-turn-helix domain-containing protein [Coriobacteriia bacterium]|nr:helix-turn-helix domain-containing protein [Coriobacteriia bacterium]
MKLGYDYLLEYLSRRFTVLSASEGCDARYGMPTVYVKGRELSPGRIYIISEEDAETLILHEDVLLLICCSSEGCAPGAKNLKKRSAVKNNNVFLLLAQEDISQLYAYLVELFFEETAWQEALWALYSNAKGSTVKDYLDASVGMFDGVLVYYPVGEWKTCIYAVTRDWETTELVDLLDEDGETYSEEVDYSNFQKAIDSVEPAVVRIVDRRGNDLDMLAVSVWESKQYYVGMFALPIDSGQATQAQIWRLARLRDAWELYLATRLSADKNGLLTKYGLLRQLLTNPTDSLQDIKKHLKTLGFPSNLNYSCAVVRINSEGAYTKIPLKQYRLAIETMGSGCYALEHESDIVVVLDNNANKLRPEAFFQTVLENISPVKAQIGISFEFTDILLLRLYAIQAHAALETGSEIQPGEPIHAFRDVATRYILTHGTNELPARMLCVPGLLELQKRSDAGGIDYIDTLRTHLKNSCNASFTARALNIHRSTLLYRLERINKITQMDLEDPDDRFYLELSLALLA